MTETSPWLHRAEALQRYVGYDIPLDRLRLTATHNSFTHDRDLSTHANYEVLTAQIFSMTDQLSCLGVRGLELDPHYIDELAEEGDEESAIRLCHTSDSAAGLIQTLCTWIYGWDVCNGMDVFDYDEDTGCRPGAPTAREGFAELATWLKLPENANEVLFIKLDSHLNDEDERVSTILADEFGEGMIFSPASWEEFSGNSTWPSPAELVALGTRVVIVGPEPSSLVFSDETQAVEVTTGAQNFDPDTCDEVDGFPEPSWHRVQGNVVTQRLTVWGFTVLEVEPDDDEEITADMTQDILKCGLTPTLDRIDPVLMEATMWSWATDRPETGFEEPRAAIVSVTDGRWTDVDRGAGSGETHSYACRSSDSDRRFDWVIVPMVSDGEFGGEFHEAEEACISEDGYVFGAPRTAYENTMLRSQMEESGVPTAWIKHTSPGDELGSSICWTHETSAEYCVDVYNGTCTDEPEPVTEFADGQLLLAKIPVDEYVRPDYEISKSVEILHKWARVAGDNDFDLSAREYVVGIMLAAVTVFIFGLVVACCCLSVGYMAAGSKEHRVGPSGFFGLLYPAGCKRGDFVGSRTLRVGVCFTMVTIIGAAFAIYGVRSVDSDVVNMSDNLQGMGQVMVEAQTRVETIFNLLGNVQDRFVAISSCYVASSLEDITEGIASARDALRVNVEDDGLGSVGHEILAVEESFSDTTATRRWALYLAGALALMMSVMHSVATHSALRKDTRREGGWMRTLVLIRRMILPLTLLVTILCWFIFGVSTSVALLTSDFCVEPSRHLTSTFSSPMDQDTVAFYTSCEGPNVFSDQLSTAHVHGSVAQRLLDDISDDDFAAQCPDEVASKSALDDDIASILDEINALGRLVQCSNINPLFVDGLEKSICNDGVGDIWFVIGGFAIVSVGLFVLALSFRLLLRQKQEDGLYKAIVHDTASHRHHHNAASQVGQ
eukprot:g7113.t1